jgi:hypothetical protein
MVWNVSFVSLFREDFPYLECTPREAEQDVSDQKHRKVDSEELNKEETGEEDESGKHSGPVTVSLGSPTGDLETEDLTNLQISANPVE